MKASENIYFVSFTPEKLGRFKADHKKAQDEKKVDFIFDGDVFGVVYGKYVIEYLEEQFSKKVSL